MSPLLTSRLAARLTSIAIAEVLPKAFPPTLFFDALLF
jgi:hypothetical protein